jgi:hypothetical protein
LIIVYHHLLRTQSQRCNLYFNKGTTRTKKL